MTSSDMKLQTHPRSDWQGQPTQSAIGHQDFHPNSTFHLRKDPKQQQLDENGGASSCLSRGLHGAEGQTSEEVAVVGSRINGRNPNFTMDRQERPSENLHLHLQVSGSKGASAFVRRSSMFSSASTTSPSYLSASPSTSTPPSSASVTGLTINKLHILLLHAQRHASFTSLTVFVNAVVVFRHGYSTPCGRRFKLILFCFARPSGFASPPSKPTASRPSPATAVNEGSPILSSQGNPPHDAPMGVSMGVDSMAAPPAYPHPMDPNSLPPHPQNLRPSFHQYNHSSTPAASTSSPQVSSGPTRRLSFTSAAAAAATSPHHRSNHAPPPLYRRRRVQSLQSLSISNPSARPSASTMSAMHQPHIHSTSMPTYPSSAMPNIMSPYPVSPSIPNHHERVQRYRCLIPHLHISIHHQLLPTSSSLHYSSTPSTESSFLFLPSTPVFDVSPHPFAQPSPYPSQTHPPTIVPSTPTDPMFPHQEPAWPAFTGLTYDDHEALGGMVGVDRSVRSLSPSSPPTLYASLR
ncbi:hypothetical protein BC829DRAFT_444668 [Chytridium lagenaria]|nr:hypothetical protein BC829DRAFT_444668 [Chytridium lagenaria]